MEIQEALNRSQPESVPHATALTSSLLAVGRAEAAVGRPAEARAAFERALAVDTLLADRYPACRFNVACSLALMIPVATPDHREDLARRAVDALRRARAAGYGGFAGCQAD